MKKNISLIFVLIFVLFFSFNLQAQIFKPFTKLQVIKTEKFDLVFPEKSRRTAEFLAKNADAIYDKYSKLLKSTVKGRIPVIITPDVNTFNAFASPVPYPAITLYDTPLDSEFMVYGKSNFESVFIHELTHLLSLSSENAWSTTKIFGTWASWHFLAATPFMMEGVTVSFESIDGFGRANDPLVKEKIRQDIRENKFKTPIQASWTWDKWGRGNIPYEYGGLFSKYLQDTYGFDKYADFWYILQNKFTFSIFVYNNGTYNAFKRAYGFNFLDAWNDFKQNITILNIKDNYDGELTKNNTFIASTGVYQNKVYFIDNADSSLKCYEENTNENIKKSKSKTKEIKRLFGVDIGASSLDISKDGTKVLISSENYYHGFYRYVVKEYSLTKKTFIKKKAENLIYARYFRDGIVGISKDLNNSTLVFINSKGESELLLPPNNLMTYTTPSVIDDENIALIVSESGIKTIKIFNYKDKTLSTLKTPLKNNNEIFNYVRNLNSSSDKLVFSYNDNDRFYKAAVLDLKTMNLTLHTNDYSGGFFSGVYITNENGEKIYYRAMFADTDALMKYPNVDDKIKTTAVLENTVSVNTIENSAASFTPNTNLIVTKYNGAKYFKPFAMWVPLPLYNDTFDYLFTGVQIMSVVASPSLEHFAMLWLGYDIVSQFLQAEIDYTTTALIFPINLLLKNSVVYFSTYRYFQTYGRLSINFDIELGSDRNKLYIIPSVSAGIFSKIGGNNKSAFTWGYGGWSGNIGGTLALVHRVPSPKPFRADIIDLSFYPIYSLNRNVFRIDSDLTLQTRYIPLRAYIYGAYSKDGVFFNGSSRYFSSRPAKGQEEFDSYVENNYGKYIQNWIFGYSAEFIGSVDLQANAGHLYFNYIFVSLAYRASIYKEYLHSLMLKVGVKTQIPVTGYQNVLSGEPYVSLALKLPTVTYGKNFNFTDYFYIGFGLSASW